MSEGVSPQMVWLGPLWAWWLELVRLSSGGHAYADCTACAGFNTTKGALIRSMLFPKPMGFKFYRDSIRFIGVLAGVAVIGFCFSAVQFVRVGVSCFSITMI